MLFYPSFLKLDDIRLTDQGRAPVEILRDERSVTNELASGKRKKYIKAVKHTITTSWTLLPSTDEQTIDGGAGRNTLRSHFSDSGDTHLLIVEDNASGDYKEYDVFINNYTESIVRRDPSTGVFLWEVSMEFMEQ